MAVAAVLAALASWIVLTLSGERGGRGNLDLLERDRAESERAIARLRRELADLAHVSREQTEVFQILPDLVRQMFAATSKRNVAPVALKMVDQLFHPVHSALFFARPAERQLAFAEGRNLPANAAHDVAYGHGRVGYVAETRLTMDEADYRNVTATAKRQIEAGVEKWIPDDVVAPVEDDSGLLGVLCMGGVQTRTGQEKRLLKMVADLTAVALTHVGRLRSTEQMADIDSLTGAYNKRYFLLRLGDEMRKAKREHAPLSLLILDIDHFKHYNDANGHVEGDEVLKTVGRILTQSGREDDVAVRYGGEEFIVLYPGASKEAAFQFAQALRQRIESHSFRHGERQPLGRLTVSGGVATYPEDSQDGVALVRAADDALYEAKAAGRNRILPAAPSYLT